VKPVSARIARVIPVGTRMVCADNTGAKILELISVKGYKGRKRRMPAAGVANMVVCTVKQGTQKWRHQVVKAVIIRQKKEYRRPNGMRVKFADNAAVIVNGKGEPQGSGIKGPIAKEVVERFSMVGKIASIVV